MRIEEVEEFRKDLTRLSKRYKSLRDDIRVVKKVLPAIPQEGVSFASRIDLQLPDCDLHRMKVACKSLKGEGINSALRLVYAYFYDTRRVTLLELSEGQGRSPEELKKMLRKSILHDPA